MTAAERLTVAAAIWHELEHGAYDADLPLWRELAAASGGPVLDLGAGIGRVAADLAARGHEVTALDRDPALLAVLSERDSRVTTVTGDARNLDLGVTFDLVIAPMQLLQIVGGRDGRAALLERARAHVAPGGRFAAAIADARDALGGADAGRAPGGTPPTPVPPLPDMLERDGWVFSSLPVAISEHDGCVVVTRRREVVSPQGGREEEQVDISLDLLTAEELESEVRAAGFAAVDWREVPETEDHIGSAVIICTP